MPQGSAQISRPQTGSTSAPSAGYAGDLSPKEAWDLLVRDAKTVLVDCRSQAEWSFVGVPDLGSLSRQPVFVEWQSFTPASPETGGKPRMAANPDFVADVAKAGVPKDVPVVFICRSGGRSKSAAIAMTAAGWKTCFNLAGGFEGVHDAAHHRGTTQGWKASGLPWAQE
jgi:rhodanese-related sulfurtransferase